MATKKKISRKKLREPDEFVSTTTQILEYVSDNWKVSVSMGVVLLLIVGGVFMWRSNRAKKEQKAFALYHVIQSEMHVPQKTNQPTVKICSNWDKLEKDFQGTSAAMYGTLQQMACLIEGRAYEKGVNKAASLLQNTSAPGVVRVLALFLRGCGLEEKKAYRKAEKAFKETSKPLKDVEVRTKFVIDKNVVERIAEEADKHDIVFIGATCERFLKNFLLGVFPEKVVGKTGKTVVMTRRWVKLI
jgi:predicted negative regulator of RcsB-dependent stress response